MRPVATWDVVKVVVGRSVILVHWVTPVEVPSTEIERFELSERRGAIERVRAFSVTCKLWKLSANLLSASLEYPVYIRLPNKFIYLLLAAVDKIYLTSNCHLTCLSTVAHHQAVCNGDVDSRNTLLYNIQCRRTNRPSWHHICCRVRRARHRYLEY